MVTNRMWLTWKEKLKVLEDLDNSGTLIKVCAQKHNFALNNVQRWRPQRHAVLQVGNKMCDAIARYSFLNIQTMYQGRAPMMKVDSLHKILKMHRDLRDRDRIVTLNLIAADLKRLDRSVQGLSLAALRRRIWRHINKHGIVQRHVTHVAHHTCYEQSVIQDWVSYLNQYIKIVITRHVMWSTLTIPTSTLTLHLERLLLGVANERVAVVLQAHQQGVLFCLESPWMARNSLPL
jgi:hypothetical protein